MVQLSPFALSKALYQAILEEAKGINFHSKMEIGSLYKEIFCAGFASPKIEKALYACFDRCTYDNGKTGALRINADTFEPAEAREDYLTVCVEVAQENIGPFMKSLYAEYQRRLATAEDSPA